MKIFSFLKLLFKRNKLTHEIERLEKINNIPQRVPKKESFYNPKQILIFEKGKLNLVDAENKKNPLVSFSKNYKIISTISTLNFLISVFLQTHFLWIALSGNLMIFLFLRRKMKFLSKNIVSKINLLEDGKNL